MKVKLIKPSRVNAISGEFEVTEDEAKRLLFIEVAEVIEDREIPEKEVKVTRKKK